MREKENSMEAKKQAKPKLPDSTKSILLDLIDQAAVKSGSRDRKTLFTMVCQKLPKIYKEETLNRMGIQTTAVVMQMVDYYLNTSKPLSWEEKVLGSTLSGPIKLVNQVVEKAIVDANTKNRVQLMNHIYRIYKNGSSSQKEYYERLELNTKENILKAIDVYFHSTEGVYTKVASFLFF